MKLEDFDKVGKLRMQLDRIEAAQQRLSMKPTDMHAMIAGLDECRVAGGMKEVPKEMAIQTAELLSTIQRDLIAKLGLLGVTVGLVLAFLLSTPVEAMTINPYLPTETNPPSVVIAPFESTIPEGDRNPYGGRQKGGVSFVTFGVDPLTPCEGSWDGPGLTACELIGQPGMVGGWIDLWGWTPGEVLWSITARPGGGVVLLPSGALEYTSPWGVFDSLGAPLQFAYWEDEKGLIIGVEDLSGPSDWDYNDFVQRWEREEAVPEPGLLGLILLGGIGLGWRARRNGSG